MINLPPHLKNMNIQYANIMSSYSNSNPILVENIQKSSNNILLQQSKTDNDYKKASFNNKRKIRKKLKKEEMKKKAKIYRKAAGEIWEDPTLEEWEENDFRLFCGDLGNEVTDEILCNSFRKYPSFQKARVIRDKKTCKSKGYGFVSFMNSNDYIKAMREMNGKYVGNRPIRLKRSNWKDRSLMNSKSVVEITKFKKNKPKIRKKILISNSISLQNNQVNNNAYQTQINKI